MLHRLLTACLLGTRSHFLRRRRLHNHKALPIGMLINSTLRIVSDAWIFSTSICARAGVAASNSTTAHFLRHHQVPEAGSYLDA
jgi:hypothetical protein